MIKIKFEANSVAELRSLIAEYLGAVTTASAKADDSKKKKTTEKAETPPVETPVPEEVATPVNTISIEDIRTLVLSGQIPKANVKGLLSNFGVERITEVPENDYAVFYEQLSALKED